MWLCSCMHCKQYRTSPVVDPQRLVVDARLARDLLMSDYDSIPAFDLLGRLVQIAESPVGKEKSFCVEAGQPLLSQNNTDRGNDSRLCTRFLCTTEPTIDGTPSRPKR